MAWKESQPAIREPGAEPLPLWEAGAGVAASASLTTVARTNGAVFEDSPLVKKQQDFAAGFSVVRILGESKTIVDTKQ